MISNNLYRMVLVIIGVLFMMGCDAAIVRDGKIIGIHSGRFISEDGYLRMNYRFNIDQVWPVCEKVVADMKAQNVEKIKKISKGTIKSLIQDENVMIIVEYVTKELTTVSVLVGLTGNNIASQLIHEKIGIRLHEMSSSGKTEMTIPDVSSSGQTTVTKKDETKSVSQPAVKAPDTSSSGVSAIQMDPVKPVDKSTIKSEDIK